MELQATTAAQTRTIPQPSATRAPARPAFDPVRFVEEGRIHIHHATYAVEPQSIILLGQRELLPQNRAATLEKLNKIRNNDGPSILNNGMALQAVLSLAELTSISPAAKKAAHDMQAKQLEEEAKSGIDSRLARTLDGFANPATAFMREHATEPPRDAASVETLRNGIGMFIMIDEALRRRPYPQGIYGFNFRFDHPEAILSAMSSPLGHSPESMRVAAKDGSAALGKLLGLDDAFIKEAGQLVEQMSQRKFSANLFHNWQEGRKDARALSLTLEQKQDVGKQALNERVLRHAEKYFDRKLELAPETIASENKLVSQLRMLPPELVELHYRMGTEFYYTSEGTVRAISPNIPAYGFFRDMSNQPGAVDGVRQMVVSQKDGAESHLRLMNHEASHLWLPQAFDQQKTSQMDALVTAENKRLGLLERYADAWIDAHGRGNQAEMNAVRAQINESFVAEGLTLDKALGKHDMHSFCRHVSDAAKVLRTDSEYYSKMSYDTPAKRFAETVSRYAELHNVSMRDDKDMLTFIAPNMTKVYNGFYLPHIREQLATLVMGPVANQNTSPSFPQAPNVVVLKTSPKPTISAVAAQHVGMGPSPELGASREGMESTLRHAGLSATKVDQLLDQRAMQRLESSSPGMH